MLAASHDPALPNLHHSASRRGRGTDWLSLGPASEVVGVDRDTLRRWADEGRVEVFHTPGGHRRFSRRSLLRIIRTTRNERATMASLGATPGRLAEAYRRTYLAPGTGDLDPVRVVAEGDREVFRVTGRQLVTALISHLDEDRPREKDAALATSEALARLLGARLATAGLSLTDSVALFVAARRPFLAELGALARRRALDSRQVVRLFSEASDALDHCLLGFIDGHRAAP